MSREAAIGHALIDAIQGAPLLRSDNEEPRLLVWSANAPEQLGALATQHAEESLRSETARLRALLDERTALLRECEGRIASIIQMSGPGQCDSCGLPEAGDEQWEREHREHPSGPEGESYQCWCLAYCWEPNDCRSESREEAVADILNDLSSRIAATLKETTCDS